MAAPLDSDDCDETSVHTGHHQSTSPFLSSSASDSSKDKLTSQNNLLPPLGKLHSASSGVPHARRHPVAATKPEAKNIPLTLTARRLFLIAACGNDHVLYALCRQMGGRLPLQTLSSVAPHLSLHVQAAISALHPVPPSEAALQIGTQVGYDGVHLTLAGFCGAMRAVHGAQFEVLLPRHDCYVLCTQATERGQVQGAFSHEDQAVVGDSRAAAGAAEVASTNLGGSDSDSDGSEPHMAGEHTHRKAFQWFDPSDGVNCSTCHMKTLLCRWPQLLRLLSNPTTEQLAAAQQYLAQLTQDEAADPKDPLLFAYHTFMRSLDLPCLLLARPGPVVPSCLAGGSCCSGPATFVAANDKWTQVLGWTPGDLQRLEWFDSDMDQKDSLHWLWPDQLPGLLAQARQQRSQLLSTNHPVLNCKADFKRIVHVKPPAALGASSSSQGVAFTRLCGHQSQFSELHPSGKRVLDVIVLSSILHDRHPRSVRDLGTAAREIDALAESFGYETLSMGGRTASTQLDPHAGSPHSGSHIDPDAPEGSMLGVGPSAFVHLQQPAPPPLQELHTLDLWTSLLLRQRLAMLLCFQFDPVLCCALQQAGGGMKPALAASRLSTAERCQLKPAIGLEASARAPWPSEAEQLRGRLAQTEPWQDTTCPFPGLSGLHEHTLLNIQTALTSAVGHKALTLASSGVPQMLQQGAAQQHQCGAAGNHASAASACGHRVVVFGGQTPWVQRTSAFSVQMLASGARWAPRLELLNAAVGQVTGQQNAALGIRRHPDGDSATAASATMGSSREFVDFEI